MSVFVNGMSKTARVYTGSYVGDGTDNRPVAHKMAKIPDIVLFVDQNFNFLLCQFPSQSGWVNGQIATGAGNLFQNTAGDLTNFYVGTLGDGSWGNDNLHNMNWVGIA